MFFKETRPITACPPKPPQPTQGAAPRHALCSSKDYTGASLFAPSLSPFSLVLRWQDTTTVENPQATARRPVTWWKRWHRISKSTPRLRPSSSATFAPGVGPFSPHRVPHCQTPLLVLKRDRHDHISPAYGACGSSSGCWRFFGVVRERAMPDSSSLTSAH